MAVDNDKQHDQKHDKHFYDTFMMLIGILVVFAFGMYFLARSISSGSPGTYEKGSAEEQQLVDQRLAPVGDVQVSGSTAAPAAATAATPAKK